MSGCVYVCVGIGEYRECQSCSVRRVTLRNFERWNRVEKCTGILYGVSLMGFENKIV